MDIEVHLGRGGTARYRHWGPFRSRWDRQIWTLRSNFRLWDSNLRALRSKIWTKNFQISVLRSKNWLLRVVSRPKWLLKIFRNIPGSFRLDFWPFSYYFKGKSMKIKENQEKSDFNTKSLTSIPFGGPICRKTRTEGSKCQMQLTFELSTGREPNLLQQGAESLAWIYQNLAFSRPSQSPQGPF